MLFFFYCEKNQKKCFFFIIQILPSQRQGQKQEHHSVWVIVHDDGTIFSANCTCMAG